LGMTGTMGLIAGLVPMEWRVTVFELI